MGSDGLLYALGYESKSLHIFNGQEWALLLNKRDHWFQEEDLKE